MTGREAVEGRHTVPTLEDDEGIAESLERGLTRAGYRVHMSGTASAEVHVCGPLGVDPRTCRVTVDETVYGHGFRLAAKG